MEHLKMPQQQPIIEICELTHWYIKGNEVLHDLDLNIDSGEILGILGPNGAGKSTLFKLIMNQIPLRTGSMLYEGHSLSENGNWVKNNITYCPQNPIFYQNLTVKENLQLIGQLNDIPKEKLESQIINLVKKFHLLPKLKERAKNLSGGQKQRLNLMLAFLKPAKLFIMDEPFKEIDLETQAILFTYFEHLKQDGTTIVISSHDFEKMRMLCDRIAVLNFGRFYTIGRPEEIINKFQKTDQIVEIQFLNIVNPQNIDNLLSKPPFNNFKPYFLSERRILLEPEPNESINLNLNEIFVEKGIQISRITFRKPNLEDILTFLSSNTTNKGF